MLQTGKVSEQETLFCTAGTKAKGDPKFKRRPKLMYVALQLQPDILLDFIRACLIFLNTAQNPSSPLPAPSTDKKALACI